MDGCPFPACDKEVKKHRGASIIPSENGPCGWLHGLHSHSLAFTTVLLPLNFHSLFSALSPPARTPAPPFFLASRLSEKRLHNVARSLERILRHPPVDGAHVDNPRRMSLNKSIYHTHLMKAQLGTSQLYKELSSLSTPASPAARPRAAQAGSLIQPDFSPRTVMVIKAGSTIVTLFFRVDSCGG